ncbi:GNAT family N-acetyltransferase [Haloarchaeobius sp. DFWS5]|uniref:GNAT family N-acetyltransferase n=1 Tax=Haloarchaeobius sp. DFWS5 TaxID=3446114 RepID=UPI003EBE34FC
MDIEQISLTEWREKLPSSGVEVFHDPDALSVLADHTDAELRLFGGYKGDQAVALLPVFVSERRVGRAVFSPLPDLGVPRLGPILDPNSPKKRKHERVNRRFTEGVIDALDLHDRTTLCRMICPVSYDDPRPFGWNDHQVSTHFTYVVDLDKPSVDDVLRSFSKSLRREMRKRDELDLTVEREDVTGAMEVYGHVIERYEEQDESVPMSHDYVRDLVETLDDDRCRVYVARAPDGEYLSGIIALFSNDMAYFWSGGAVASYENVSVNTLIHQAIIEDVMTDPELDSVTKYDLMGANTERLCGYKAKFGGELVPYYTVESAGPEMTLAKSAYRLLSTASGKM